jgi:hypothetical protein
VIAAGGAKADYYLSDELPKGELPALLGLSFWRFLSQRDIYLLDVSQAYEADFYKYITRKGLPSDFLFATAEVQAGCRVCGFYFVLKPPSMQFQVLVLENISSNTLDIGEFLYRDNVTASIRSEKEENESQRLLPLQRKNMLPQKYLLPGERVVIPSRIVFSYLDEDVKAFIQEFYKSSVPQKTAQLIRQVERALRNRIRYKGDGSSCSGDGYDVTFSRKRLLEELKIPFPRKDAWQKTFIYGPSMTVASVEINGSPHSVRPFDPSSLVIVNGYPSGSCPHVYTYSEAEDKWVFENPILVGADAHFKERSDRIRLNNINKRVRIAEEEMETSYIDQVNIIAISENGEEKIFFPIDARLRQADGSYVTLEYREALDISFEGFTLIENEELYLYVKGYYKPVGISRH